MSLTGVIGSRLAGVRSRVAAAALAAGRDPGSVRIVAVTKKVGAVAVRAAYEVGHRDFGENYVQEAVAKIAELGPAMPEARWHFVGRLQSNKAGVALRSFSLLHGIDSAGTAAAVSRAALREARVANVLLQVRLGRRGGTAAGPSPATDEAVSPGGAPRGGVEAGAAAAFLAGTASLDGIRFVGLMGVADPDLPARPQFASLRELGGELAALALPHAPLGELSMGMTGDFEDAVAEGATLVRIGTAIFGERPHD